MKLTEKYVDDIIVSVSKSFPEGLVYNGCKRCTPREEFAEKTKKNGTRREFDVAKSDIYMMKYYFSYKGEMIDPPRHLYLPYVSEGGCITMSASRFNISPILTDKTISVDTSSIFIRLTKDRLTFKQVAQHFLIDSKQHTVKVVWSLIYHRNPKMKLTAATTNAKSTLMHYLFCKYGFTKTFEMFGGCKPIVGGTEINTDTYPPDEWSICTSNAQIRQKSMKRGYYEPSTIRVAVRKSDLTPMVRSMLGGFFYTVDNFPDRILPEHVDKQNLWMILMGHIIFSGSIGEGKLYLDIADHIGSLDEYLDNLIIPKLKDVGVDVENIYQLFSVIIERFNDWMLEETDKVGSMWDKELSILYYILEAINHAIVKMSYKLTASAKTAALRVSAGKKELTIKDISAVIKSTLKPGLIFSITKNHGEVSTISNPGDNKAFKVTSMLIPQTGSKRSSGRKDRAIMNDPTQRLHVSIAEVGGYSNLPKSDPSGRNRVGPFCEFDSKGVIIRNPKYKELLDSIQKLIQR
jgi:hypothetical protein